MYEVPAVSWARSLCKLPGRIRDYKFLATEEQTTENQTTENQKLLTFGVSETRAKPRLPASSTLGHAHWGQWQLFLRGLDIPIIWR